LKNKPIIKLGQRVTVEKKTQIVIMAPRRKTGPCGRDRIGNRLLSALISNLGPLPYTAREIVLDTAIKPLFSARRLSPDRALNPETRPKSPPDSE
jgi:hypothetical protein